MRVQRMLRFTLFAGIPALVVVLITSRLLAQTPWAVKMEPAVRAQPIVIDRGAAALWQCLLKLHTRASVIAILAHPDDEDGGMLAYESRGQGARAALLTLNRGEGGQNVMSNDFWDRLGLVRTEELLAADQYYGAQQYFSRVVDFGFSKYKSGSLQQWGYDRVLSDVVRVIRMVRPLVVTSTFVGAPSDGHGQHEVSGEMAQIAYKDAGNPNMFPNQIREGLLPWSPLKMYARVPFARITPRGMFDYATGRWVPARFENYITGQWIVGEPPANVAIPEGQYDPMLGSTFIQIARQGWGMQKSQNGGPNIVLSGPLDSRYHRYASRVPVSEDETSFFQGIDISLPGIADLARGGDASFLRPELEKINERVESAMRQFSPRHPDSIAPLLADGLRETNALLSRVQASNLPKLSKYNVAYELRVKQAQFNDALAIALGISIQATVAPPHPRSGPFAFFGLSPTFQYAVPGQHFDVNVHLADEGGQGIQISRLRLAGPSGEQWTLTPQGSRVASVAAGQAGNQLFRVEVPKNAAPTEPYFTRPNVEQAYYDLTDPRYRNLPFAPYPLSAWAEVKYDGVTVRLAKVVQVVSRQIGLGTVLEPLAITPAISVLIHPHAGIIPLSETQFPLTVDVRSEAQNSADGAVRLDLPTGWSSAPASAPFSIKRTGDEQAIIFHVRPSGLAEKPYVIRAVANYDGKDYTKGFTTTGYPGLRPYNFYRAAEYRTTGVNVRVASGLNIGYVMGTGDDVPQSLQDLGITVHLLTPQDIAGGDLSRYSEIVLGIRAYAHPDLADENARLLDYVRRGGVLVVQYQTMEFNRNYGPYPMNLGTDEKVVNEHSSVRFLLPNSPILTWPNHIAEPDFQNWVEERGHGFMGDWSSEYQAPLEMHDKGQAPQKGGLIYARYGKGVYVYVALALYRQLQEGVPGAYRIFANLLSLSQNPAFRPAADSVRH